MRLDKFLKISLLFKTRSSAEKAIEDGLVLLNEKVGKPASTVNVGDSLVIITPFKKTSYEILMLPGDNNVSKQAAKELFKMKGEEKFDI